MYEKHAEVQARKDKRAADKTAREAVKRERARKWTAAQERFRVKREKKDRIADVRQQRRLEDNPDYLDAPYYDSPVGGPWTGSEDDECVPEGGPSHELADGGWIGD
jgi:hypothetical protein